MTLPLTTTSITFKRPAPGDPYEPETGSPITIATVPAVVSSPSGRGAFVGGTQEVVDMTANCEPCNAIAGDWATDNSTQDAFRVLYVQRRYELGFTYLKVGLKRSDGAA